VGMTFFIRVVKPTPDGSLADIEGALSSCSVRSNTLFGILDRIEERKRGRGLQRSLFPWYQRSFDYDSGRKPKPADCFSPRDVLSSLQGIERELQTNSTKYPFECRFHVPQGDGRLEPRETVTGYYRGKACRLFGDDKGCWAVETETSEAFPLHYELTGLAEVVVKLAPDGPDVTVGVERKSFLTVHGPLLQQMKQVCLTAMQQNGLVLTSIG